MGTRTNDFELTLLAGAVGETPLPPRLNTAAPATELGPSETPDAYGMDLSNDGLIGKGSIPTSTARVVKTVTIDSQLYSWHYKRLWGISGTTLIVGAQNYDNVYYQQGPDIPFNEDAQSILDVVPFGPDFLFIPKSTGGYALQNCGDSRGSILFQRSDIIQEAKVGAADRIVELNGNVYVSNDKGLMMLDSNLRTTEMTRAVRNAISTLGFPSLALTADYQKRYVIGGSSFVLDTETGSIFRYSGSSFLFTTRQFHRADYSPFNVDRLVFVVEHTSTSKGTMKVQIKLNDQAYGKKFNVPIPYTNQNQTRIVVPFGLGDADRANTRTFQLKITSISSGKFIKQIWMDSQQLTYDDGFGA